MDWRLATPLLTGGPVTEKGADVTHEEVDLAWKAVLVKGEPDPRSAPSSKGWAAVMALNIETLTDQVKRD